MATRNNYCIGDDIHANISIKLVALSNISPLRQGVDLKETEKSILLA